MPTSSSNADRPNPTAHENSGAPAGRPDAKGPAASSRSAGRDVVSQGIARVTRHIDAAPAEVFKYWTDIRRMARWMCADDLFVKVLEANPTVGGAFTLVMSNATQEHAHHGEFVALDPGKLIAFTWKSSHTHGITTLVTVTLTEERGGTRLLLVHEKLPSAEVASHTGGWRSVIDKLTFRIETDRPESSRAADDVRLDYLIDTTPDRLYAQLATRDGIANWWTDLCTLQETVGGFAQFDFVQPDFQALARIARLEPSRLVVWDMLDCSHAPETGLADLHDWGGTQVIFEIIPEGAKTRLRFTHRGLARLASKATGAAGWSRYLGESLVPFLETGQGKPARAPAAA